MARLTLPQKAVRPRRGSLALGMRTPEMRVLGGLLPHPEWGLAAEVAGAFFLP
ncbi:MAG: hypothetical protein WBA93_20285 [Microcoleaceae cyanobacterium]